MKKQKGFTLPEILITVVVIGIIAAITINIINTNAQKAEVETKYKIETDREKIKDSCKSTNHVCGSLIQKNSWKIPKDYPIKI